MKIIPNFSHKCKCPSMKFKDPSSPQLKRFRRSEVKGTSNARCSCLLSPGKEVDIVFQPLPGSCIRPRWKRQRGAIDQPTNQLLLWYNFNLILSWPHLRNHCRVRQWGKCQSRNLSVESASNEGRSGYSRPLCPGGAPRGCDKGELSQEPEEFDRGKIVFGFLLNYLPGQIGPLLRILWEGHVHWCSQTGPEKEASFNCQLLKE